MKKKNKKFGARTTAALIVIIFILGMGGTMWYYALYKVAYVKTYEITVETVGDKHIGFNADPTLNFGSIPSSGGTAKKEIVMVNDWEIPLLIEIRIKGEAAHFIKVADNNFILQPGEVRKLNVFAIIPGEFNNIGIFKGEANIMYFRP